MYITNKDHGPNLLSSEMIRINDAIIITLMPYSISLGGSASATLDAALRRVILRGTHASVSAGNDGINACNVSPARVSQAYVVEVTN